MLPKHLYYRYTTARSSRVYYQPNNFPTSSGCSRLRASLISPLAAMSFTGVFRRLELGYDVDVSWWVTPAAYDRGHYVTLYRALQRWVVESFPFVNPYYSNREIPG